MSAKTVFISYRRDPIGKAFAGRLFDSLKHHGYDVFLDVENNESGKWRQQIFDEVQKRGHFILVLTPDSLIQCSDPSDDVRFEFETAAKCDRNIVPVKEETDDLSVYENNCPPEMKHLFDNHGLEIRHNSFHSDIDDLIKKFIPNHKAKSPVNGQTISANPIVIANWFTKAYRYLTKNYTLLIDNILTATVITVVGFILYNFMNTNSWAYVSMIPISFTAKLFWNSLSLPREIKMTIQVILIGALIASLGLLYFIEKVKSKEQPDNSSAIIGLVLSAFLSGVGYGISTTTAILRSSKK